jgi:hypothetical protein
MSRNVLDGVMALETKAAKTVDAAKATATELRKKVDSDLRALAARLDAEAEQEITAYTQDIEARKQTALAELDRQLQSVLAALETVKAERVGPLAEEVTRLLEQRADGH